MATSIEPRPMRARPAPLWRVIFSESIKNARKAVMMIESLSMTVTEMAGPAESA